VLRRPDTPTAVRTTVTATTTATIPNAARRSAGIDAASSRQRRSGTSTAAVTPSITVAMESPRLIASRWNRSGPKGSPIVREMNHRATVAMLTAMARRYQRWPGNTRSTIARSPSAIDRMRKNTPAAFHSR
jgi:hypothetical protein